jgi:single-stranded-DNA-specific exonuclease
MEKRWVFKPYNEEVAQRLQQQLNINPVICRLLAQRGIVTYDQAKAFFRPELSQLHDPFLMKDMDKAIDRIERAMHNKEKILIYGDYDVDGTTAVALVFSFFKKIYYEIDYYIPDRYKEGYGVSMQGVDYAKENGITLIIALDCGIKSKDKIEYATSLGIDFIVCDHHLPPKEIPNAAAVLDPKRPDCKYPFKELSGCGIGFKLLQAFTKKNNLPEDELIAYLDLVAVSIASDIVPMLGENRVLAYFGLQTLNNNPRKGFKALIEASNMKRALTISDVVFVLGPRINAAGRIDDARHAVKLLISETVEHANDRAEILNKKNQLRREFDFAITEEALSMLDTAEYKSKKYTILYQPHWNKGVIGIVASRLIERYYRPTIVFTESNGMAVGLARSLPGFDLYKAISQCSDLLDQFGGHMFAAGLSLKKENLPEFISRFEKVVNETIDARLLIPEVEIDAELEIEDISIKLYNIIKQFAPFGPGNMKPVFITKGLKDTGGTRIIKEEHLKVMVSKNGSRQLRGIAFGKAAYYQQVTDSRVDICYTLEENEWNDNISIEMNVKDIKESR